MAYGVCVGKKLKAYGYRGGTGQYGIWQLIKYTEKVKDKTGAWIPAQSYQLWLSNKDLLDLADGTDIEIEEISKVNFEETNYGMVPKKVCNVTCKVKVLAVQHENKKGVAGNNYINRQEDNAEEENPFASGLEVTEDDLPF